MGTKAARSSRVQRYPQQASLPGLEFKKTLSFGGSLLKSSHAKTSRPLSSKQALHVVLRSEYARGTLSFLRRDRQIRDTLAKVALKHGVRIYRVANAGNHLHLLVRFTQRRGLQNFLRGACGLIARQTLDAQRGRARLKTEDNSLGRKTRFWSQRPFTRIVAWGRDFEGALSYLKQNTLEAFGFVERRDLSHWGGREIRTHVIERMSLALGSRV